MIYLSSLEPGSETERVQPECSTSPPLNSTLPANGLSPPPPAPSQTPPQVCNACGIHIADQYLLLVGGRAFHTQCVRCALCQALLGHDPTCFYKDGLLLCRTDYFNKYANAVRPCAGCHNMLLDDDIVMRARDMVFHVQCFNCSVCQVNLSPGDIFTMDDASHLFCQVTLRNGFTSQQEQEESKKLPRKVRKEESSEEREGSFTEHGSEYHEEEQNSGGRSKRMRTSFKHHQLRTMKNYFNLNHNPDAKDLKQLAQKTGLTKRVLQVWFQNARAKYRRSIAGGSRDGSSVSPVAFSQQYVQHPIIDQMCGQRPPSLQQQPGSPQDGYSNSESSDDSKACLAEFFEPQRCNV